MLPTSKTPPRTNLSDLTVLIYGPTKAGKCLRGDTLLIDPASTRLGRLDALVEQKSGSVLTMKDGALLVPERPAAYLVNEPQQLFRLTTQTGRSIEATASHPFLTRGGWRPLSTLSISDRVATVAEYPDLFGRGDTDDNLIKILAYMIADGGLGGRSKAIFTKNDPEVRLDFQAAVEAKGDECVEFSGGGSGGRDAMAVRVRGKSGSRNNVLAYLREVGLQGLRSAEKFSIEEIIDPRDTRRLICEFAELALHALTPGPSAQSFRP